MSTFSEEKLVKKLQTLNETQASILAVSQWTLFHHRHAEAIAQTWAKTLTQSPVSKKLPLIYLANDVIQRARASKRDGFPISFGKVINKSLSGAYVAVDEKVRAKIRRSVNVWKERKVLPSALINDILANFDKIDGTAKKANPSSGAPKSVTNVVSPAVYELSIPELKTIDGYYRKSEKLKQSIGKHLAAFDTSYGKLFADDSNLQSPSIFLNQIQGLLKSYNEVKSEHEAAISNRKTTIGLLEELVKREKSQISEFDQFSKSRSLDTKLHKVLETKKELEQMIVKDAGADLNEVDEDANEDENEDDSYDPMATAPESLHNGSGANVNVDTGDFGNGAANEDSDDDALPGYEKDGDDSDDDDSEDDDYEPKEKKAKLANALSDAEKLLQVLRQ